MILPIYQIIDRVAVSLQLWFSSKATKQFQISIGIIEHCCGGSMEHSVRGTNVRWEV